MSQSHLIAQSFKDVIAADKILNARIPGNVHYGEKLRPEPGFDRPYARIVVKQLDAERNSGGGALVEYKAQLTVYGGQEVGESGETQELLSKAFGPFCKLPSLTGRLIGCQATEGFLSEDEDDDQDQDVMVCTLAWKILIQE